MQHLLPAERLQRIENFRVNRGFAKMVGPIAQSVLNMRGYMIADAHGKIGNLLVGERNLVRGYLTDVLAKRT